jgi:serine/threonine-protein kinase RsbW
MNDGLTWLTLPASIDSLPRFTEFVREGARLASVPETEFNKLDLVLEEIVVNVARYAYPEGQAGDTEVGYSVAGPGILLVQVRDSGRPYNPLEREAPDLTLGLEQRRAGGLGIFLIRTLTEAMNYSYVDGRNTLSITFCSEPV